MAASAVDHASSLGSVGGDKLDIMNLPLIPRDMVAKDISCSTCGSSAWSESPFHDASPGDCYNGMLPWNRYKASDCQTYKIPRDPGCKVCHIAFNASSLRIKFGDRKKYMQHLSSKPEEHGQFKKNIKTLVNKINDSGQPSIEALKKLAKMDSPLETVAEDCAPQSGLN